MSCRDYCSFALILLSTQHDGQTDEYVSDEQMSPDQLMYYFSISIGKRTGYGRDLRDDNRKKVELLIFPWGRLRKLGHFWGRMGPRTKLIP